MGLIEVVTDRPQSSSKTASFQYDHDRRDLRLDACRGLALWFIFIDHIPDNSLSWLTMRNYGFSDASEIFVFVSGYTCMLAYGGAFCEQGWRTMAVRALRRAWEIYAAFLMLILFYVALVWIVGGGTRFVDATNTGFFFRQPGAAIAHAVGLQFAPVDTDILLTFVILHAIFPALFWMLVQGPRLTLAVSFLVYLMVQLFDWRVPAWPDREMYFDPLAWQFLFVIGAWYSFEGAPQLRPLLRSRGLFLIAAAYLVLSLIVALSWQFKSLDWVVPGQVAKLIYPIDKGHLAPLRLLHFLSLALVVSRLARPEWSGSIRPLMLALIRCGENSLSIYCVGVLLAFLAHVILVDVSSRFAMQFAVSLAGIAVMIAAATLLTWESRLDRRGPKLF